MEERTHGKTVEYGQHAPNKEEDSGKRELHVVVHGLIGIRMYDSGRYGAPRVELHIPEVPMHRYEAGDFANLRRIQNRHDYELVGVGQGQWKPSWDCLKDKSLLLAINSDGLTFNPQGTHAKMNLPWPDDVTGIRQIVADASPNPLFHYKGGGLEPKGLKYIYYLTYNIASGSDAALVSPEGRLWFTEGLAEHTRLHIFADPPFSLLKRQQAKKHFGEAYDGFDSQLFQSTCDLRANWVDCERMVFQDPEPNQDVPVWEQGDLVNVLKPVTKIACTGNCLSPLIRD